MNLDIEEIKFEENETIKDSFVVTTLKYSDFYSHIVDDMTILDQENNFIDFNIVRNHFKQLGRLSIQQAMKILYDAMQILKKEPNVVLVDGSTYVLGDIHGQYFDLIDILEQIDLSKHSIVFLGDYVDRGQFSCEVYFYLLLLKTHFPKKVFLLRGNHESKLMTTKYTFKKECLDKYDQYVYELCLRSFMTLPLAGIVEGNIFCVHGGISKECVTIKAINSINRFTELNTTGPMCDLLWSDPNSQFTEADSFSPNSQRRCSFYYNYEDVKSFLNANNLKCIVRGHELSKEGYKCYEKYLNTPSVITIFSAPDYCATYRNKGAFLKIDKEDLQIKTFTGCSRPFVLPNNMDGINWSFPFVGEKIVELYIDLLKNLDFNEENSQILENETNLVENEIIKSNNLVVAIAIMRAERENLNCLSSNTISLLAIKNPLYTQKDVEKSSSDLQKPTKETGLSIKVPPSMQPLVIREIKESSIENAMTKASIEVDKATDTATIQLKNKRKSENSFYKCCF